MVATSTFIPATFDGLKFETIDPLIDALLKRPVSTAAEYESWLFDRSELESACSEARANLYITMTCDTEDKAASSAYLRYVEEVQPKLTPRFFELDKRQVELATKTKMTAGRYEVLDRTTRANVDIFRQENVPIQTDLDRLEHRYKSLTGAMLVNFEGRDQTLPQMAKYQEATDRAVRESAWRAVAERRLKDKDAVDVTYTDMVTLRDRMARNAGFKDFVGYAFKSMHRFDYTVKHCETFHEGVEKHVVPLMRALEADRARHLKVDVLRPWDLGVDVKGRGPLRPFEGGADLMRKAVAACERLDPRLGRMLTELGDGTNTRGARDGACLDLDSRKGKAPGGYQYMRDLSRKPFIFMNAAGLHRDVETMVHEAGHAFHSMLCRDEPLLAYRHSPIEFAEVASMSMELLTMRHWGGASAKDGKPSFYPTQEDFSRAMREQLKRSVLLLPWIATIDAFQHWVYTHPSHTVAEREAQWLALDARFGSSASWEGLDHIRPSVWQRQLHLFSHPFYYIEYGIAQLGALQLWLASLEQGESAAVESYMRGLRLGGSKPLPELFAAAGLQFDFGPSMIARISDRVRRELDKVPE